MKFGHLILRKIIKFVVTRCQIVRLKCNKFDFGWGSTLLLMGGEAIGGRGKREGECLDHFCRRTKGRAHNLIQLNTVALTM